MAFDKITGLAAHASHMLQSVNQSLHPSVCPSASQPTRPQASQPASQPVSPPCALAGFHSRHSICHPAARSTLHPMKLSYTDLQDSILRHPMRHPVAISNIHHLVCRMLHCSFAAPILLVPAPSHAIQGEGGSESSGYDSYAIMNEHTHSLPEKTGSWPALQGELGCT